MKQRLKQQSGNLFRRIIPIIASVWIVISAAYCVICLFGEKNSIQNRELSRISNTKQRLRMELDDNDLNDSFFHSTLDLIYSDDVQRNWDSQFIVIDGKTNDIIINTSGKIVVKYGVKIGAEMFDSAYGLLSYSAVRQGLSDEQIKVISDYLNSKLDNGEEYELICTKFHFYYSEFVPLEIKIALKQDDDSWFVSDEIIETFSLGSNLISGEDVWYCNDMRRNIIPKEFFLSDCGGGDIISALSAEQRDKPAETVSIGFGEYIFYISDVLYIHDNYLNGENNNSQNYFNNSYVIQYARKINVLDNSREKLLIGTAVIFVFFLAISCILCFMIRKIVMVQVTQEQRRNELTNALAHDIKTPLFVISGYAYSLKEDIDVSERDNYLDKIIEQTDVINTMVHRMLNLTKLNSNNMVLNNTDFDIRELLQEILDNFKILPSGKKIKFTYRGSGSICADRELLKTAFTNLIDNAVKYSLDNSLIEIDVDERTVCISNQSEHLTNSDLNRIWQPYVRKDKSRSKNGNGLGLSIVKSIFDLHNLKYSICMDGTLFKCRVEF